jgi:hypothetical protein
MAIVTYIRTPSLGVTIKPATTFHNSTVFRHAGMDVSPASSGGNRTEGKPRIGKRTVCQMI